VDYDGVPGGADMSTGSNGNLAATRKSKNTQNFLGVLGFLIGASLAKGKNDLLRNSGRGREGLMPWFGGINGEN